MGLVATFGRLLSAAGVLFFVHIPADATAAALVASCATLLSGLMLLPHWWQSFRPYVRLINWMGWKSYINDVKHTIFSGFFASASSLVPVLVLGVFTGPFQTGLFTAADRLTRAGAFLLSFIEQSLMGWFVKNTQNGQSESLHIRRQVLLVLSGLLMVGCGIAALMSPLVLEFLYGQAFVGSIGILQILLCWLMVHGIRKAVLAFYWSAVGDLKTVAMFQWSEAILVSLLAIIGAVWQGGLGVAICLCISEALLLVIMVSYLFMSDR
jgi:O-antigen/teichoic acid export membrane protein